MVPSLRNKTLKVFYLGYKVSPFKRKKRKHMYMHTYTHRVPWNFHISDSLGFCVHDKLSNQLQIRLF